MTEEIVDFEAYREQLVEKLESVREFRSTEAVDGDDDDLMARAAEVLRTSVHEVEALPAHDARLRALAIAAQSDDDLETGTLRRAGRPHRRPTWSGRRWHLEHR